MLTTIEGTYREGQIRLKETPAGVHQARVLVTFIEEEMSPSDARTGFQGLSAPERTSRLCGLQAQWAQRLSPSDEFARAKAAEIALEERRRGDSGE